MDKLKCPRCGNTEDFIVLECDACGKTAVRCAKCECVYVLEEEN